MLPREDIVSRLQLYVAKIDGWRSDAERLRATAAQALDSRQIATEQMVEIEETSGAIYEEIERFNELVSEVKEKSPEAAAMLAEVGDALQLVLMEITELGTSMYSVRSDVGT